MDKETLLRLLSEKGYKISDGGYYVSALKEINGVLKYKRFYIVNFDSKERVTYLNKEIEESDLNDI